LWRDWDWEGVLDGTELTSSKKLKSVGSGEPEREGCAELVLLLALRFMPARERLVPGSMPPLMLGGGGDKLNGGVL
jgi:hypothetical protein